MLFLTDTCNSENIFNIATWERVRGMGKKDEGIKKYKLLVTEQSSGCKV